MPPRASVREMWVPEKTTSVPPTGDSATPGEDGVSIANVPRGVPVRVAEQRGEVARREVPRVALALPVEPVGPVGEELEGDLAVRPIGPELVFEEGRRGGLRARDEVRLRAAHGRVELDHDRLRCD